MSSDFDDFDDLESIRAEIRQAREEANQNAWGTNLLLVIIACGGFGAFGSALSGLIIPAIVLAIVGLIALALWGLYRLIYAMCLAPWKTPTSADPGGHAPTPDSLGSRLFAIELALTVFGGFALMAMHAG
jgi:hypothetical protein